MLQEALFSTWAPLKTLRSIGHPGGHMRLIRRSDILDDNWHSRHRGTNLQAQTQFQQIGWPPRPLPGQVDFEDRQPQGPVNVGTANPVRRQNTSVTGEAEENGWLNSAMEDLAEAPAEAQNEEFPVPSTLALENARRLLLAVYKLSPRRFEVYPTPDGEVAIDAPGGYGRSVLLLCDSDGGALCLVNMDGRHRRARYSDMELLPDGFVREALEGLARRDELAA